MLQWQGQAEPTEQSRLAVQVSLLDLVLLTFSCERFRW